VPASTSLRRERTHPQTIQTTAGFARRTQRKGERMTRKTATGLGRRTMLKAAAIGALAAPMLNAKTLFAQSGAFNWRRFQGQSLEISLVTGARAEHARRNHREFEELTGIRVGAEVTPEQQQRQKVVIEFSSGRPSFDIVHLSYHVQKRQFARARWLAELNGMLADPQLTPADWDRSDVTDRGLDYATDDGRISSLPWNIDYWMLYWNKELFQAKGVQYPRTIDEIVAAAQRLHDPAGGVAGMVARGLRNANVPVWTQILLGYGQETVSGTPPRLITDGDDAIAAAEIYKKLLRDSGPPGVSGFNWNEAQSLFAQGRAAMWIDGVGFAPPLEDRQRSRVVGKVGYGVFPRGPKAHHAAMFGDGIGVSAASQKKEAAYLYCVWLTSKSMSNRLMQGGGGVPPRRSTLRDPQTLAALTVPREWAECVAAASEVARAGLPVIVPVTEFRDVFGTALTNTIGGADPAAELRRATAEFKPVLERSEQT
jgi:multiple sugar transport system substrate-binding protein